MLHPAVPSSGFSRIISRLGPFITGLNKNALKSSPQHKSSTSKWWNDPKICRFHPKFPTFPTTFYASKHDGGTAESSPRPAQTKNIRPVYWMISMLWESIDNYMIYCTHLYTYTYMIIYDHICIHMWYIYIIIYYLQIQQMHVRHHILIMSLPQRPGCRPWDRSKACSPSLPSAQWRLGPAEALRVSDGLQRWVVTVKSGSWGFMMINILLMVNSNGYYMVN